MAFSQSLHRENLLNILADKIRQKEVEESLSFGNAAARILIQWLGYDLEDITFIDGSDRGVDAWVANESSIEIFQVKTHESTVEGILELGTFNGQGVSDLARAKNFLLHERAVNGQKNELNQLLYRWASVIRGLKIQESQLSILITLHFIILGDGLTEQGRAEFDAFEQSNVDVVEIDGVPVQFHAVLHTIDDIIDARWREENRKWEDVNHHKCETINLQPWPKEFISDSANAIFYCRAIDLVNAYDVLGYQLFEPNVRANIRNSRVNKAIRDSIAHQQTRREFRFLNNGVTITCNNFAKPNQQRLHFNVKYPGIVNGLQTVVALHTAYKELSDREKEDFEKNCSVLVRLLLNNAVDDISNVVKATNNQNPMKPRNLVSNSPEQLMFTRLFAQELNWFYEAKEGAWNAFVEDPQRWRPHLNKKPKDFRVANSRKERRIDNEDLAQVWLAFIGFSREAVNEKKWLFDDRFYSLTFKQQLRRHGTTYETLARARDEAVNQAADCSLMLAAYLTRELAAEMAPSASQNRSDACKRLGLDPETMSKPQLDVRLNEDDEFILNQALGGMSLLFTEFVGFILYQAFEEKIHRLGRQVLANHSFNLLATGYTIDSVKDNILSQNFDSQDVLAVLWLAFVETIKDMLLSGWGQSYRAANIKIRFTFSRETRDRLYRDIRSTNDFMKKRSLNKIWAVGVAEGQGLFEFVRECVVGKD